MEGDWRTTRVFLNAIGASRSLAAAGGCCFRSSGDVLAFLVAKRAISEALLSPIPERSHSGLSLLVPYPSGTPYGCFAGAGAWGAAPKNSPRVRNV